MTRARGPATLAGRDVLRREAGLLLVLTFATGIVDAVGYLVLARVFTGNMTGNTALLGMSLTGAAGLGTVGLALALSTFWVGAVLSGRALRGGERVWTGHTTALLGATGLGVGVVALALARSSAQPPRPVALASAAVLGACMGLQAATVRQLGVADVPTVIVDEQVTGLAGDLGRRRPQPWVRRSGSIVMLVGGALVGTLLIRVHAGLALGVAGGLAVTVALVGYVTLARTRPSGAVGSGDPVRGDG
ncbi:YoaK family protein [Cellulomonas sp. P22]|uniref:YoaK family protein n=1 Tax=Cellulomonas sp. P22 TaxID=3373189 RepID=UPI0037909569